MYFGKKTRFGKAIKIVRDRMRDFRKKGAAMRDQEPLPTLIKVHLPFALFLQSTVLIF